METNENSISYALTHSPNKLLPLIPLISKIRFQFINFWQVSNFRAPSQHLSNKQDMNILKHL